MDKVDIIFAGSFLCNLVLDGIAYSFGVLLQPLHEDLKIGVGSISLIGGVLAGVILATGPIAAFSVNKYVVILVPYIYLILREKK